MRISSRAIVVCVGSVVVGVVACLLRSPGCLWALILVEIMSEGVSN